MSIGKNNKKLKYNVLKHNITTIGFNCSNYELLPTLIDTIGLPVTWQPLSYPPGHTDGEESIHSLPCC